MQTFLHGAGYLSLFVILVIIIFQVLFVLGLPLGEYTLGGKYKGKLPVPVRVLSFLSIFVLMFFALVVVNQINLLGMGHQYLTSSVNGTWFYVITGYLAFNTAGNIFSKSRKEKLVMTPLSGLLFLCFLFIIFIG